MPELDNYAVAGLLEELGTRLELTGDSPFKVRAYFAAAESLRTLEEPLASLIATRRLKDIPGVGGAITEKILVLHRTGTHPRLDQLRAEVPDKLLELTRVPGLGAKRVRHLREVLGIGDVDALEAALRAGRVAKLKGFGEKLQAKLLDGVGAYRRASQLLLMPQADALMEAACAQLRAWAGVQEVCPAGEVRRRCEVVSQLSAVVAAGAPGKLPARAGPNEAVRVTAADAAHLGLALLYETGSAAHLAALEARAQAAGLRLSREGLFRGDRPLPVSAEREIYAALKLPFIRPEWREGRGELEAAEAGRLPRPLDASDVVGVLHCHSRYSDGLSGIPELAAAAQRLGLRYLGIADHSQSAFYAGGLREDAIYAQHEEIDKLNEGFAREGADFRLFKGIESDILPDGALDYPGRVLVLFDFVVVSIHSQFNLDRERQTERMVRAVSHPAATMLGHPTGRLLRRREGYALDVERVLEACARHGVAVELNAHPERLDLDWRWHARAVELGIKISINPDAHSTGELAHFRYGLDIARKGRVPSESLLNSLDAEALDKYFQRRKPTRGTG
jgi:DNA polymerase (family 10)